MRVAFSVPARIGCAVVRNRIKRRIRAVIRQNGDHIVSGAYLIRVHDRLDGLNHSELSALVNQLMRESSIKPRCSVGKNRNELLLGK